MTISNERKHLKMVIWRVLNWCGVIKDRSEGQGSTALHSADQPQVNLLVNAIQALVELPSTGYDYPDWALELFAASAASPATTFVHSGLEPDMPRFLHADFAPAIRAALPTDP